MPAAGYTLYDHPGYFAELKRLAETADPGDHITIMAMAFSANADEVSGMMAAMADAARRGVNVLALIDAMSFMLDDANRPGPLWLDTEFKPKFMYGSFGSSYELLQDLKQAGGAFKIINRPAKRFSNPYAGRSHIKLALANNQVFIGGCNFEHPEYPDIMVGFSDYATADWLRVLTTQIASKGHSLAALEAKDLEHAVSDTATIYIDAGIPKQSTILRQAHRLIDEAQEFITITCQYFPGGETAQRLLAAHKRGVTVKIYFSPPAVHGLLAPLHWGHNHLERRKLPAEFFAHEMPTEAPKLHAKILVSEKSAMVGSHNYVQAGVNLGTSELALRVDGDAAFNKRLVQHIFDIIA